jgi:hypothetical protein
MRASNLPSKKHKFKNMQNTNDNIWFWRPQQVDGYLQLAINFSSRGPGGVWRRGLYHFVACRKEDLRIGSEEVWRIGGGSYPGSKRFEPHRLSGFGSTILLRRRYYNVCIGGVLS